MCGRYFIDALPAELQQAFGVATAPPFDRRWNLTPTSPAPVLTVGIGGRPHWGLGRWGLTPHWTAAARSQKLINARGETVASKPVFRDAWLARPCIVPARGWYEWSTQAGLRQPHAISANDGRLLGLAGLWAPARDGNGIEFAIVTTAASADLLALHERMPVLIEPEMAGSWLSESAAARETSLRPASPGLLRHWPVSTRVNAAEHDDALLLRPVAGLPMQASLDW